MKGAADVGLRARIYATDGTGEPGATLRLAAAETGNKVIDEHETAAALASVNIFGGFLVTQRMLAMYRKKDKPS